MNQPSNILIGSQLEIVSEIAFLRELVSAFNGPDSLILANFLVGTEQIDFLVVTDHGAGHVELKQYLGPITGGINGPSWTLTDSTGVAIVKDNAYRQAVDQSFALSDAMRAFRKRFPELPAPPREQHFRNFRTYVAIRPSIDPKSQLTAGDAKARVRGASDVIDDIRSGHSCTWGVVEWRRFAIEHLELQPVTLAEAIDSRHFAAAQTIQNYRTRFVSHLSASLPPPVASHADNEIYGSLLIDRLVQGGNTLLLGPGGSAKTFHLQHTALSTATNEAGEIPIFIDARRYKGGEFMTLVRHAIAPVHIGDARSLLDSICLSGRRPLLILDGFNECAERHRDDLLLGVAAFAVQYEARTIISSQVHVAVPGLTLETISVSLPNTVQSRAIYAYHARIQADPELDRFCGGFRNAYELKIAGISYRVNGRAPETVAELYDRYVASCLPQGRTTIAGALARRLAEDMGARGSLYLQRDECEAAAEALLREHDAPITVLDDLFATELLDLRGDVVVFEHELLVTHFRATAFLRRFTSPETLGTELGRPINQPLIAMLLPRLADSEHIAAALRATHDAETIANAMRGDFGSPVQRVALGFVDAFIAAAMGELEDLLLEAPTDTFPLMRVAFSVQPSMTALDKRLADALGMSASDPAIHTRILQIIDATEAAFASSVDFYAWSSGRSIKGVWSDLLHATMALMSSQTGLRCTTVLQALMEKSQSGNVRTRSWHDRGLDPNMRDALVARALQSEAILSLYILLDYSGERPQQRQTAEDEFHLIRRGWDCGIGTLRLASMMRLHGSVRLFDAFPDLRRDVVAFIEPLHSKDLILSTAIVDALSRFDLLASPVSEDEVASQIEAVLRPDSSHTEDLELLRSETAYHIISNQFEDVYQGVHYEAIEKLSDSDRADLFIIAARKQDGFQSAFILGELLQLGSIKAVPTFRAGTMTIDVNASFLQDQVAGYILAHVGYAQWAEAPPVRPAPASILERAWHVLGDAIFWLQYDSGKLMSSHGDALLNAVSGDDLLAMAVALAQLQDANLYHEYRDRDRKVTILRALAPHVRRIVTHATRNRNDYSRLNIRPSFRSYPEQFIKLLSVVGDETTLPVLRELLDDQQLGAQALSVIREIEAGRILT